MISIGGIRESRSALPRRTSGPPIAAKLAVPSRRPLPPRAIGVYDLTKRAGDPPPFCRFLLETLRREGSSSLALTRLDRTGGGWIANCEIQSRLVMEPVQH